MPTYREKCSSVSQSVSQPIKPVREGLTAMERGGLWVVGFSRMIPLRSNIHSTEPCEPSVPLSSVKDGKREAGRPTPQKERERQRREREKRERLC